MKGRTPRRALESTYIRVCVYVCVNMRVDMLTGFLVFWKREIERATTRLRSGHNGKTNKQTQKKKNRYA
jgi:hypothetical protein